MTQRAPAGIEVHPEGGHYIYCDYCNYQSEKRYTDFGVAMMEFPQHLALASHKTAEENHGETMTPKADERVPLAEKVQWLVPFDANLKATVNKPQFNRPAMNATCLEQIYKIEQTPYGVFVVTATKKNGQHIGHNLKTEFALYGQALDGLNTILSQTLPMPTREWILEHYHVGAV